MNLFTASRRLLFPLILTFVVVMVSAACSGRDEDVPLIFAAASLADVLTEVAEAYESETGRSVDFNFGGSTALANQVARLDAPADGVIVAGDGPMILIVNAGLVSEPGVSVVARNSLVVVSNAGEPLQSLGDLEDSDSLIAIADPELAPAGQYAREALLSAAVWDRIEDRVVPTLNVRAALAAASSGSAEFAIVYATDALTEPSLEVVLSIDAALHAPIVYPAAVIEESGFADAAQRFLDFVSGPTGQRIFAEHSFFSG